MKKYFYLFILSSLFLSPFHVQAIECESSFGKLLRKIGIGSDINRLSKPYLILAKELADPKLPIQSTVLSGNGMYYGNGTIPLLPKTPSEMKKRQPEYLSAYLPPKKRGQKGQFVLSFRVNLNTKTHHTYQHWIYWPSDAKNSTLSADQVKEIFNEIYKEAYGKTLEWMIEKDVISKTITQNIGILNQLNLYDIFNFNSLFFKDKAGKLKQHIIESLTHSDQASLALKEPETSHIIPSKKMSQGMRRVILESYTIEEIKKLPPETIKTLELTDVFDLFNTPEKIQTLDMSLLPSGFAVKLLIDYPLWRESITSNQIKQLNATEQGIQYVFVPTFKHYTWRPKEEKAVININNMSDKQIMDLNRDTFLRDVFLAGDLFVGGILPPAVNDFMILRGKKVKELDFDTVMDDSISKGMHDFIVKKLGFDIEFESMTPELRRKLFKKEIEMMTNNSQQAVIIIDLVAENETGNHNWF